jgi:predicted dehydrogenase
MGRAHARAARRAGGRLVGVCDLDRGAAAALAARSGASVDRDAAALLERVRPDVVHVCTPPGSHRSLAELCLRAGAHALIEKPFAPSLSDAEAILSLARERALVACPIHQLAFQRWLRRVGAVGETLDLCFSTCSAGGLGRGAAEVDGVAGEILPHPLSLFERIAPGSLARARWTAERPRAGELRAQAARGSPSLGISISLGGRPPRHELRVTGTRGTLWADLFHGFAVFEGDHPSRAYKIARPFALSARQLGGAAWNLCRRAAAREPAWPGLRSLVGAAYAEIRGEGPPALPPDHARAVERAREAILGACREMAPP